MTLLPSFVFSTNYFILISLHAGSLSQHAILSFPSLLFSKSAKSLTTMRHQALYKNNIYIVIKSKFKLQVKDFASLASAHFLCALPRTLSKLSTARRSLSSNPSGDKGIRLPVAYIPVRSFQAASLASAHFLCALPRIRSALAQFESLWR